MGSFHVPFLTHHRLSPLQCLERFGKVDWDESRSERHPEKNLCWSLLEKPYRGTINFCVRREQLLSSRTHSEGSPKMFFPTGKLIGSSRLLFCWLEASEGRKGIPKPASQAYQHGGGRVSAPICQMEHVKGQPAEQGRQQAWKAKHANECSISPRKKQSCSQCLQLHHSDSLRQSWGCR